MRSLNYNQGFLIWGLLALQSMLLAYSATRHSPTDLEPAFLASGLICLEFGRLEAYRVNPPLPRIVAALPVYFSEYKSDWSSFDESPGSRFEFALGDAFLQSNATNAAELIKLARWACIPFGLIGTYFAYRWATELYGLESGIVALFLFAFEPNLLAHGELATPDSPCTSFAIVACYAFWKWLRDPSWVRMSLAGVALGVAELSKMTLLVFFVLWPLLYLIRPIFLKTSESNPSALQMVMICCIGVYIVNLGYGFDGTGTRLGEMRFVSTLLSGENEPGVSGNRFDGSCLGAVLIPLPTQYVLGFDSQARDFEKFQHPSYLRGVWSNRGWWYYYLYGLFVKVPCGTWFLFGLVIVGRLSMRVRPVSLWDELMLVAPAITLFIFVSYQTAFSIHLRYVFPALGLTLIFISQSGRLVRGLPLIYRGIVIVAVCYSVESSIFAYPNHFAYFNDFIGGSKNGQEHLLGSSLDWGQGTYEAIEWIVENEPQATVEFETYSSTFAQDLFSRSKQHRRSQVESALPSHLILYSAERWSKRRNLQSSSDEEIVKRFPSGCVLSRRVK